MGEPDETSNLRDVEALKTPPWTPAHQASLPKTPCKQPVVLCSNTAADLYKTLEKLN